VTGDEEKTKNRFSPNDPAPRRRLTPNGSQKSQSGFTLLEVIIVLLLSLLILGMVMVSFAGLLSSAKLQATVREFSATLRQARDLAKIHGEQQGWTIDLDSREYGIEGRKVKKIPSNLDLKIVDSINGEIRNGQYRLVFEPNGGMAGATFQLSDKKKVFGIELDPLLGAVVTR
jgi:general secretion pathway protein H